VNKKGWYFPLPAVMNHLLTNLGNYHQKKLNIKHDLNAALLAPAKIAIDAAFRNALDTAPTAFKAQAAQKIKAGINNLNRLLKGRLNESLVLLPY
jgi:hypothetical protein